jgi:hypothetical protein
MARLVKFGDEGSYGESRIRFEVDWPEDIDSLRKVGIPLATNIIASIDIVNSRSFDSRPKNVIHICIAAQFALDKNHRTSRVNLNVPFSLLEITHRSGKYHLATATQHRTNASKLQPL